MVKDFKIEEMTIAPVKMEITDDVYITLSCETPDTAIYYTTDLSMPTIDDEHKYSAPLPMKYNRSERIVAFAVDKNGNKGAVSCEFLEMNENFLPSVSLPEGDVESGTSIALMQPLGKSGFTIRYTTDGTEPAADSAEYTLPLSITNDTIIRARVFKGEYIGKSVAFRYYIKGGDRYEENNTINKATVLSFPFEINDASLHTSEDTYYYKVTVNSSGTYHLSLNQTGGGEIYKLDLITYSPPKTEADMGTQTVVASCALDGNQSITRYLKAGDYYVKVSLKDGSGYSTRPYSLKFCLQAQVSMNFSEMNMLTFALSTDSFYRYSDMGVNQGGMFTMSTAYLNSWQGPCEEYENPYPTRFEGSQEYFIDYKHENAGTPKYTEYQSIYLPNSKNAEPDEFRQILKSALYCYGAVEVTFFSSYQSVAGNRLEYVYDPIKKTINHAVALVGWDDNVSKENFSYLCEDETILKPKNDGAWIIKNSWGADSGDNGYIYISYEDTSFCAANSPTIHVLEKMPENYDRQYTHSETGMGDGVYNDSVISAKNRFTSKSDEKLKAVGFTSCSTDTFYSISVSKKADQDKEWSKPVLAATGRLSYPGFYTIPLTAEIDIKKGEQFDIIVCLESANSDTVNIGVEYTELQSKEISDGKTIEYATSCAAAVFHQNESFLLDENGNWNDTFEADGDKYNFDIRAYTDDKGDGYQPDVGYDVVCSKTQDEIPVNPLKELFKDPIGKHPIDITGAFPENMANGAPGGSVQTQKVPADSIKTPENTTLSELPSKFDLRDIGVESYVKNQGEIGSCWTFAATSSAELTMMRRSYGNGIVYNISLPQSTCNINVGEQYYGNATITAADGSSVKTGYDVISWQFSGDLDSIEILEMQTRSGTKEPLFRAKDMGTVTITATVNGDMSHAVSTTAQLVEEPTQEPPVTGPSEVEKYTVNVKPTAGGSVSVVPASAAEEEKVDVVVKASDGYSVYGVSVNDEKGNFIKVTKLAMDSFRFAMPKGKVTIAPKLFKNPYSDIINDRWYYENVAFVTNNSLMKGIGNGMFSPDKASTRAEIWQMLYNMISASDTEEQPESGSPWYTKAKNYAMSLKITDGTNPMENITREQLAVMLYRYAKDIGIDVSLLEETNILSYNDAFTVSEYAIPAMQWACKAGLINGDDGNLFPKVEATRSQVAAILHRFCEKIIKIN